MPLTLTTPPTTEPVGIEDLKTWLGYPGDDQNTVFQDLIQAATGHVEKTLWRQLVTATYTLTMNGFPTQIFLPRPPFQSLTSITYIDTNGDSQTLSSSVYQVSGTDPAMICAAYNQTFPSVRDQVDSVTVTYVAGYGASHEVPEPIRQSVLMIAASWWNAMNCGGGSGDIPQAATNMLATYELRDTRMLQGV